MWNFAVLTKFYQYYFRETRKKCVKSQSGNFDVAANIQAWNLQNTKQVC